MTHAIQGSDFRGAFHGPSTLLPRGRAVAALPPWRLRRVQEFIEEHIASPLRLSDLAAVAGLSRMHFAAQFHEATGCQPHEYVLKRRIERATAMIADRKLTMVQIALDIGFQSQAHFCTIFKRLTGVTPTCWRRVDPTRVSSPSAAPDHGAGYPGHH